MSYHDQHQPYRARVRVRPSRAISPAAVSAFRLPGPSGDPAWFGDDMGGAVDPGDPRLNRRDFVIRVAVAAAAVTVGGGVNILTTALACRTLSDADAPGRSR